jgi:hypothetical protein
MEGAGHNDVEWDPTAPRSTTGLYPPEPTTKSAEQRKTVPQLDWSAQIVFKDHQIPPEVFQRILQIEEAAKMNIFDGPLQPICWDKRGNRVNADSPSVHTVLDPAQDGWDALWGPLPQIGLEAATTVMAWTRQEDVDLIKMWMMRRRQLVPHRDGKRKFSKFEENTATQGGLKLTPQRLLIGWFADTYTSNSNSAKMVVDHTFVDLQKELGIVSSILQWLQYIGRLLWHQRIFSTGVTLAGLRLRFALPVKYLSGNARTGLSRYRFDAEFQVFMWDTQKGKDMTQEMVSLVDKWREDLLTGIEAMRHCAVQIQQEFWKLGADVLDLSQVAVKRRISFRPGFSPLKVDDSEHVGKFMSSWFNSHNKHPSPKVLHLPEMYWQATGDFLALDALGSFMELYKVNEAIVRVEPLTGDLRLPTASSE